MIVDTHAHLSDSQFDADRDEVVQRAFDAGVDAIVEIGESEAQWPKARALSEKYPGKIFWAAGFHPYYAEEADPDLPRRLKEALIHPRAVAVGEIGLDYHRKTVPPATQKKVFSDLLQTAVQANKPVILHLRESGPTSRDAENDAKPILAEFFNRRAPEKCPGVLHCFQGSLEFAQTCADKGFLLGVDGPVTYPNAKALRAVLKELPLEGLVLETDCPYLPPQEKRGGRNEPSYAKSTAQALAELKGVSTAELEKTTARNARRLFRF